MKKISLYLLGFSVLILLIGWILYQENKICLDSLSKFFTQEHPPASVQEENESSPSLDKDQDPKQENIVKLSEDQIKEMGLNIQTAQAGTMALTLSARGKITLDPECLAHIIPKMGGSVKEARKNIGSKVQAGELLAILESQEMADLQAAYLATLSQEKLASSVLEREERLYQKRISPAQDFFNAQNSYAEAHIHRQLAAQKLQALGLQEEEIQRLADFSSTDLGLYKIYAPLDGTVIMRHITQGEFIDKGTPIYEIADLNHVWVEMGIYAKDLARLQEGQRVEVIHADNSLTAQAQLMYISPLMRHETLTVQAIALLDNSQATWRPGSFVNAHIFTDHIYSPVVISKEAVQKVEGIDCAFIATAQGFEKRALTLGKSDHHNVEVLAGLLPGERYVASNPFLLKAEMNKDSIADD